jgi:hypothetical protein
LIIDRASAPQGGRSDKDFDGKLTKQVAEVAKKLAEGTRDHAVSRIANRFALVQVALELAVFPCNLHEKVFGADVNDNDRSHNF